MKKGRSTSWAIVLEEILRQLCPDSGFLRRPSAARIQHKIIPSNRGMKAAK
jgi:hypothetical protein